jgi:hypothetical protein
MHFVHDTGEEHQFLPGGADAGYFGVLIGFGTKHVSGIRYRFPPEVTGIADLNLIIVDPEIYRLRGFTLEDDEVISGVFQLGPESSP